MPALSASDLIITTKDDNGSPIILSGLRAKTIKFDTKPMDITRPDSKNGWREFLAGAAVKSVEIEAEGFFSNTVSDMILKERFFSQTLFECKISMPGFGEITGGFLITKLGFMAKKKQEAEYSINLASSGEMIFNHAQ